MYWYYPDINIPSTSKHQLQNTIEYIITMTTSLQQGGVIYKNFIIRILSYSLFANNINSNKDTVILLSHSRTRNSSADEIANVNFLYDNIVHVLQNTIDTCINSVADRRGYVLERMFTKFSEMTQYNGHYVVQGHLRSIIFVLIESSYTTSY